MKKKLFDILFPFLSLFQQGKATAPDPLINPEAKGRGLIGSGQAVTESRARSTTTSRGECSGQEKPGS